MPCHIRGRKPLKYSSKSLLSPARRGIHSGTSEFTYRCEYSLVYDSAFSLPRAASCFERISVSRPSNFLSACGPSRST
jgi:hypothetical protein